MARALAWRRRRPDRQAASDGPSRTRPKSLTLTRPSVPTRTLVGLKSRWTSTDACAATRPRPWRPGSRALQRPQPAGRQAARGRGPRRGRPPPQAKTGRPDRRPPAHAGRRPGNAVREVPLRARVLPGVPEHPVGAPRRGSEHAPLYFLEAIGRLLKVHATAVLRRLARSRQEILDGTRRRLGAPLRVSAEELESVMGLVQSELSVSIARLLRAMLTLIRSHVPLRTPRPRSARPRSAPGQRSGPRHSRTA